MWAENCNASKIKTNRQLFVDSKNITPRHINALPAGGNVQKKGPSPSAALPPCAVAGEPEAFGDRMG
eukprot:CAMPEP_0176117292 /NCGR_PEP_ID=MMETSP0120_2-20121206/58923_1 /TAXON_ID=160619 /ORGANISM="Kryptoperidinium foliaceum, Strain CCMP 1326" /LENGTH=66 /DNA_ID=CAMNT_0017451579 /DNA_START=127 /DNA_END=323 /DNA_ORIENTATION=-